MGRPIKVLEASDAVRAELRRRVNAPTSAHRDRFRAEIILLHLQHVKLMDVAERLGASVPTVSTWSSRFEEAVLTGLKDKAGRGRKPSIPAAKIERVVTEVTRPPNNRKMAKHFTLHITDTAFSFARDAAAIAGEIATDGIYVVRTILPVETLDDTAAVRSHKSLALVEQALRFMKTIDLHVRPIYHWSADRVRAHVCLCMLAYYPEWRMRRKLAPMLFDDADKEVAEAARTSIVAKAQRSPAAISKQTTGVTPDGLPVHSLRTLLADLTSLARNTIVTAITPDCPLTVLTRPTPIQRKAFQLLGLAV